MSEFAPEYTREERIGLVLKVLAWAVPLFAATTYWFFPWLEDFVDRAHCVAIGRFTGLHAVFYGLFVGLPASLAVVLLLLEGRKSLRVFKLGQTPLPGEKVLRPTRYVFGARAKLRPLLLLSLILLLLGFAVQGVFAAGRMLKSVNQEKLPACSEVQVSVSQSQRPPAIF